MTEQSEGWRAGDLAVCVMDTPWWRLSGQSAPGPAKDQVIRVVAVYEGVALDRGIGTALEFADDIVAGAEEEHLPARATVRDLVADSLNLGPGDVVLIKGSRGVGLETVAAELAAQDGEAS